MKKQTRFLAIVLLFGSKLFAQNIPVSGSLPSATYLKTVPAAYSNTPTNYLRVFAPIVPIQDTSLIQLSTSVDSVQTVIAYTDSYGRTVETVSKQMSPLKKDLVSAPFYDEFGRSGPVSYLPFTAVSGNTDDGLFKSNPFQQDSAFYKNLFGEAVNYSQSTYDGSPFNIPVKTMMPGNEMAGAGVGKTFTHRSNKSMDSVRFFQINITSEDDLPYSSSYYTAGSLMVQQLTDERGIKNVTYTDLAGRTVLVKSQLSSSPAAGNTGWLCTYYVYDEMSRLRAIIPPKATDALMANSWGFGSDSSVYRGLCFSYFYDKRGRQVEKSIPDKGKSYTAYDLADRPVMTQDPNLRSSSQWAFVLYDESLRANKTGVITPGIIKDSVYAQAASSMNYPTLSGTYTVMTQSFYDDYSWLSGESNPFPDTLSTANINGTNFITSYNTNPLFAQQQLQSKRIRGFATGSKTLILGTSDYLYGIIYYDKEGRPIQTQSKNYSGGKDVMMIQYSFRGLALRRHTTHAKSGTNAQNHTALTKYSYDHIGRLLIITKNTDGKGDKTVSSNTYTENGQLDNKTVGNNLETQRYNYNIRGMLTGINKGYVDTANSSSARFGEQLMYAYGFTDVQVNGLVAGVKWKTGGDNIARAYGYGYDNLNRLTKADFSQQNEGSSSWTTTQVDYSVSNLSYDAGGNIMTMKQKGLLIGSNATIDSLTYTYFNNTNRLQKIADGSGNTSALGDFKDSSNVSDDYAYDVNGNIVKDYNRHMYTAGGNGALFNLLDKPDSLTIAGKSCTYYTYSAGGELLKKRVKDYKNGTDLTYTYMGGYVYMNDTLQYAMMEEGRVRLKDSSGVTLAAYYDYFVKDHAGNVRAVLTDEDKLDIYPVATMDSTTAYKTVENMFYANLDATRVQKPAGYPSDSYSVPNSNNQVAMVQGSGNKTGPSITLKVMAGDTFNVRVSSYYKLNGATPGTPVPITDIVTSLINGVSGNAVLNTHGSTSTEMTDGGAFSNVSDFLNDQSTSYSGSSKPKAYLNWVLFDEQFKYISNGSGFEQVGNDDVLTAITKTNMPIAKSGYLYIYVSNETPNVPVYFDNLQVSHKHGALLETNEYYPYGMLMKNISYKAAGMVVNRYKSNGGSEYEDEGELNYTTTFFRNYDVQVGRFTGVDMLAEKFIGINGYQFGANNPVLLSDPSGALTLFSETSKYLKIYGNHESFEDFLTRTAAEFAASNGGPGGGGGGGEAEPKDDNEKGVSFIGESAQTLFSGFQSAYNNRDDDGRWSLTLKVGKDGSWGYWSSYNYDAGIAANGHENLEGVGIELRWTRLDGNGSDGGNLSPRSFNFTPMTGNMYEAGVSNLSFGFDIMYMNFGQMKYTSREVLFKNIYVGFPRLTKDNRKYTPDEAAKITAAAFNHAAMSLALQTKFYTKEMIDRMSDSYIQKEFCKAAQFYINFAIDAGGYVGKDQFGKNTITTPAIWGRD